MLKKEIEKSHMLEIEDGRLTNFLIHKRAIVDLACTIFYVMGLIFAIIAVYLIEYNYFYKMIV